jgi:hypothetical protein
MAKRKFELTEAEIVAFRQAMVEKRKNSRNLLFHYERESFLYFIYRIFRLPVTKEIVVNSPSDACISHLKAITDVDFSDINFTSYDVSVTNMADEFQVRIKGRGNLRIPAATVLGQFIDNNDKHSNRIILRVYPGAGIVFFTLLWLVVLAGITYVIALPYLLIIDIVLLLVTGWIFFAVQNESLNEIASHLLMLNQEHLASPLQSKTRSHSNMQRRTSPEQSSQTKKKK